MPATLAELEELRTKVGRLLLETHRSELEDADERHNARCQTLNEYFEIRSHEISGRQSLLDTGHVWETWSTQVSTLAVGYRLADQRG